MTVGKREPALDLEDVVLLLRQEERERVANALLVSEPDRLLVGRALPRDPIRYRGFVSSMLRKVLI